MPNKARGLLIRLVIIDLKLGCSAIIVHFIFAFFGVYELTSRRENARQII